MHWIREQVSRGDALIGVWLATGSAVVADIAGTAGFDWALVDLEHGLGSDGGVLSQLQVLDRHGIASIVRIPALDAVAVKRALDLGAAGIMVPQVRTADEARDAVRFTRYPPDGIRGMTSQSRAAGFGRDFADYYGQANRSVLTVIQIETPEAVANAAEIAAVDGVDVLFIGHSDLSLQLGCFQEYRHPRVLAAGDAVLAACRQHGRQAGAILRPPTTAEEALARGFSFLATGTDIGCLRKGFEAMRGVSPLPVLRTVGPRINPVEP
jgi:2-keto-3-deoxy-L-rhamnonate aldolase RhmA